MSDERNKKAYDSLGAIYWQSSQAIRDGSVESMKLALQKIQAECTQVEPSLKSVPSKVR